MYLPDAGLWVSEYPHCDRTQFLDVSLAVEREAQEAAAAGGQPQPAQQAPYGAGGWEQPPPQQQYGGGAWEQPQQQQYDGGQFAGQQPYGQQQQQQPYGQQPQGWPPQEGSDARPY